MYLSSHSVYRLPKTISRSKRGGKPWGGRLSLSLGPRAEPHRRICRKLEDIHQELVLLGEQGKTKGFFNNVKNAEKLGGLVEDVRDTIMDYQVCAIINLSFLCLILS